MLCDIIHFLRWIFLCVAVERRNVAGRFRPDKSGFQAEMSAFCTVGEEKSVRAEKFGPKYTMARSAAWLTIARFNIFFRL